MIPLILPELKYLEVMDFLVAVSLNRGGAEAGGEAQCCTSIVLLS